MCGCTAALLYGGLRRFFNSIRALVLLALVFFTSAATVLMAGLAKRSIELKFLCLEQFDDAQSLLWPC
jgi:hypothetical protein